MSLGLFSLFKGVPAEEIWELWMVETRLCRPLNKMFEMQFQRLEVCLEAPQRKTFSVQPEHQMASWCSTKDSEANRYVTSIVNTRGRTTYEKIKHFSFWNIYTKTGKWKNARADIFFTMQKEFKKILEVKVLHHFIAFYLKPIQTINAGRK